MNSGNVLRRAKETSEAKQQKIDNQVKNFNFADIFFRQLNKPNKGPNIERIIRLAKIGCSK